MSIAPEDAPLDAVFGLQATNLLHQELDEVVLEHADYDLTDDDRQVGLQCRICVIEEQVASGSSGASANSRARKIGTRRGPLV